MTKDIDKFDFLKRHQKKGEIDLDIKMNAELEQHLKLKENCIKRRENANRKE